MKSAKVAGPVLTVALVALVALTGCSSTAPSSAHSPSAASSFVGSWGEEAAGKPFLTIKDDGTFSGNDGCNAMAGKGTMTADTFTFGPFATIQQACEGIHPWLNNAVTATVDGTTLTVLSVDGATIGTLAKR